MYFAMLIILMKRSSSHRFFFLISKCAALHIGASMIVLCGFQSQEKNWPSYIFLSSIYVEDKKNSQGTKQLSTCLRFFLNYLKVDITSSAQM